MTDKLKAILEEMGAEVLCVDSRDITFMYKGDLIEVNADSHIYDGPYLDIDITEAGG
jgi:hypothetical protein